MSKIKFANTDSQFFNTLRDRINGYFTQNNINPTGNWKLYLKTGILIASLIVIYSWLVFFTPADAWLVILLCSIGGLNVAAIGFNVMHDGAHGSYSQSKWVNEVMAHSLNVLGGNSFLWKQKHNQNHHTYTNVEGMDDDIDIKPFMRLHREQEHKWYHRFQHIYCMFAYGLLYFFWVFYRDFKKYFTGKIAENTPMKKMDMAEHINFWVSKVAHVVIFFVIPTFYVGFVNVIIGYSIMAFVNGVILAVVFQLAHIVENTEFVTPVSMDSKIESNWAIHQLVTTTNFATKNRMLIWLLGGLNFQVEHHLFPKISHVHYRKINKILIDTCKEFGIVYNEYPTMTKAFISHMSHIRSLGINK